MRIFLSVLWSAVFLSIVSLAILSFKFDPYIAEDKIKFIFFGCFFIFLMALGAAISLSIKKDLAGAIRRGALFAAASLIFVIEMRLEIFSNLFLNFILPACILSLEIVFRPGKNIEDFS